MKDDMQNTLAAVLSTTAVFPYRQNEHVSSQAWISRGLSRRLFLIIHLAWMAILFAGCRSPLETALSPTLFHETAASPTVPAEPPETAVPFTSAAPTATLTAPPPPLEHRIGIRAVNGVGEFYDRETGEKFVPRGNNYIRLASQPTYAGERIIYHATFNEGLYYAQRASEALQRMHASGYNVVRIFLNGCCRGSIGDPAGGMSQVYLANLVDFLQKAKESKIYVLITTDGLAAEGGYIEILDSTWSPDFGGNNASFLTTGGVRAEARFWQDLIQGLKEQNAPLDAILAYQLRNELFFESNLAPLSLSSGTLRTANGKRYDMSSPEAKQRMMDEGLVYWIDQTRAGILELDPTALVTVGFFWPQRPHPSRIGDPRWIETRPALWESSADFLDLHLYPGGDLSLEQLVENYGMAGMEVKPIIMGEFGSARSTYASAAIAARKLRNWQVESCAYGFDGWLFWTWDTDEQGDFYNALAGQGEINQALAPVERPDPCLEGD